MEDIEEATKESEFSLANENHKKFYSVDHFLPKRKREMKEDRKQQGRNMWKDFEINQLKEGMNRHGTNYDLLEEQVPTRTRKQISTRITQMRSGHIKP